jgi:hypothetical protein
LDKPLNKPWLEDERRALEAIDAMEAMEAQKKSNP